MAFTSLQFQGVFCRNLEGHGHWVNTLALSTDYVMRTGAFDPADAKIVHDEVTDSGKEILLLTSASFFTFHEHSSELFFLICSFSTWIMSCIYGTEVRETDNHFKNLKEMEIMRKMRH